MNEAELLKALSPPKPAPEGFYTIKGWADRAGVSPHTIKPKILELVSEGKMKQMVATCQGRVFEVYGPTNQE